MWGSHAATQSAEQWADRSGSETDSAPDHLPLIPVAAQGGDIVDLGEFESRSDGWRAGDRVTLDRFRSGDRTGVVTDDSVALRLDVDGAVSASISNDRQVRDADWADHPFLTATITPGDLAGTDAPIHASFRLVHAAGQAGRGQPAGSPSPQTRAHTGRGRSGRSRHSRLTSETFGVPQNQPVRLYWDLSDVDERVRESVVRLDVVCERADQPASEDPYGRGATSGTRGTIVLDDVTLSDSPDVVTAAKLQTHWQQLLATHGSHTETVPEVKKTSVESGRFGFEDGAVAYTFEIRDDGTHLFTLGTTTYRFEDGMAAVERQ
jgi:hypothetical protein